MTNSKRSKLCSSEEDRISTLPDSLLSHILSFLPTKHAVGTSILSNRWKFLWTSITTADFDDRLFLQPQARAQEKNMTFMHFVNRVLLLLNPQRMRKFRLKCGYLYDKLYINTWIAAALVRDVQELDLSAHIYPESIDFFPRINVFTCNTLSVLRLEGEFVINVSTASVSFPSLKTLHLIRVNYANEECVHKLFCNCPILEDLVIVRTYCDGVQTFNVCVPLLKRLKIDNNVDDSVDKYLVINAPSLEYLDLKDYTSDKISLENMSSLVEANVDIDTYVLGEGDADGNYYDPVSRILKPLSNVKILSLSTFTMEALSCAPQAVPIFCNLTRLKVSFGRYHWQGLRSLLANSDKLEQLIYN